MVPKVHLRAVVTVMALLCSSQAKAQAQRWDGLWVGSLQCQASTNQMTQASTTGIRVAITNGRAVLTSPGSRHTWNVTGSVAQDGTASFFGSLIGGRSGSDTWPLNFGGSFVEERFRGVGVESTGAWQRQCTVDLFVSEPAPGSQAHAQRQRQAEQDLERARAAAEAQTRAEVELRARREAEERARQAAERRARAEAEQRRAADEQRRRELAAAREAEEQRLQQLATQRAAEEQQQRELAAAREAEERRLQELAAAQRAAEEQRQRELAAAREAEERRLQQLVAQRAAEEQRQRELAAAREAEERRLQQLAAAQRAAEERRQRELAAAREAEERRLQQLVAQRTAEEQRQRELAAAREAEERRLQQLAAAQRAAEEQRLRAEVDQARRDAAAAQQALERQRAELERLRQETQEREARQSAEVRQLERGRQQDREALQASGRRVERLEGVIGQMVLPLTERADNWALRAAAIPIQQQQFCRIIDQFHDDLSQVHRARNDIRRNVLYRDRQQDLAALLPTGAFENWLVRVVEVTQAADGSAAILLQPPCRVMLGSDACRRNVSEIRATVQPGTPLFRELSRVVSGDFVAVSGAILYAQGQQGPQALPQYAMYQPGTHCSGSDGVREQDVFVTAIRYLVQLR